MKRTVPILLALLAAFTLTGLFFLLTRVGPLPARVRDLEKSVKSAIADHVEAIADELDTDTPA